MGKFYVAISSYSPNTAMNNRIMGMLKEFSLRGVQTDVVYFVKSKKGIVPPSMPNIHYHYYGQFLSFINNTKVQYFLYVYLYVYIFSMYVNKGDSVYIYGGMKITSVLVKRKGVKVYHERTEHPDVSALRTDNIERYIESCKFLQGLFVISSGLRDYFVYKGVDPRKINIINMTVDSTRFSSLEKNSNNRYIAYCGTADNNKDGVDQLIKSFSLIHFKYPDVKLLIIGSPPDMSVKDGNLALVNSLDLKGKVIFTGVVSSDEMPQILKNAEVLALDRPNNKQAKYGFPTKLGEYLLTGNPVVVTKVGDIPLFLENGVSALLSEPDNPIDFSNKLDWVLSHPEDAKIIGENGKRVALESFDAKIEAAKILSVIKPAVN